MAERRLFRIGVTGLVFLFAIGTINAAHFWVNFRMKSNIERRVEALELDMAEVKREKVNREEFIKDLIKQVKRELE